MSSAGFEGGEVGSQCAVDLSCEVALEAADGFFFGFAFGDAAVEVAAGSVAVAEPDDDDHVQCPVGGAVAGEVEPVAAGAPAGCNAGHRSGCAQVGEGRFGAEPVDVLAGCDEQRRGVVGAASQTRHCRGRCGGDEPVESAFEFVGFGAEPGDAAPQAAQCCFGGLGGIGEPGGVGPQPGAHRGFALEGAAGVELFAQRGGGGDEQVAELAQRSGAGFDSAAAGDAELADRLDHAGRATNAPASRTVKSVPTADVTLITSAAFRRSTPVLTR